MERTFQPGPAALSAIATGALVAALIGLGSVAPFERAAPRPVAVFDIAAPGGSETGQAEVAPGPVAPSAGAPPPASPPSPPVAAATPLPPVTLPSLTVAPVNVQIATPAPPAPAPVEAVAGPAGQVAGGAGADATTARRGVDNSSVVDGRGDSRSYSARVRAWLLAHQIYPRRARMRHIEGTVRVRFTLDRAGQLIDGAVIASSGDASLDGEGDAMLHRSSPYPAAPRDVPGERIGFTADIDFLMQH